MKHRGGRESIGRLIGMIHRHAKMFFHKEFSGSILGSGSFHLIVLLHHKDGLTQQEISQHLSIDKANTARTIQKLLDQGYIKKIRDEKDLRAFRIYLTSQGEELMPGIRKTLNSWSEVITQGFNEDEKKVAIRLLRRMAENAINHVRPTANPDPL